MLEIVMQPLCKLKVVLRWSFTGQKVVVLAFNLGTWEAASRSL